MLVLHPTADTPSGEMFTAKTNCGRWGGSEQEKPRSDSSTERTWSGVSGAGEHGGLTGVGV